MASTRLSPTTARARLTALRGPDYTERLSDSDVYALLAALEGTPLASEDDA